VGSCGPPDHRGGRAAHTNPPVPDQRV